MEKQIVEQGHIDAEEFRRLFPLDVQRTKSILEDYIHVQRSLIAAGKTGVGVAVTILGADGTIHAGEDTAYYQDVPRLREVRDNYTAIQVGKSLCIRHPGEKYSC